MAPPQSKPMKYPYTFSAKLAQFPYMWHLKNQWWMRYLCYAFVASYPLFLYIHKKVNSPEAVAAWEEKQRQIAAREHH
ncbi:uncharacterized protein LOC111627402 [Centruroides sculpturatus]|uniref:uncharacterized protein LOC111627402 n=1 Tax=Centruroides sculpturatus TaxID=218467 RepID=UPI000C6DC8CF|nr:uncharacterized protein LOC111627402 [Centruroides sculpturatus]